MLLGHKEGGLILYIWCLKTAAAAMDLVPALFWREQSSSTFSELKESLFVIDEQEENDAKSGTEGKKGNKIREGENSSFESLSRCQ